MDPEHPSTPHPAERAPDLTLLAQVESELGEVERALQRLDEGAYGTCDVCGAPIDDGDLEASPATSRCREHRPEG